MVWCNMAYLQVLCWVCTLVTLVSSSHFRGGMMRWRPVNPTSSTDTRVEIIQRFAWEKYSAGHRDYCDQSLIAAGNKLIGEPQSQYDQLTCRSGCSGSIANMQTYCTDFGDDWSAGERSQIYNPGSVRVFEASYASGSWRRLNGGGFRSWEFRVRFNLNLRSDTGRINTSPVFNMPSIVKVQRNCPTTITIPVKDIDGDDVRCRWASSSRRECSGVCQSFTTPSTLRDCVITYSANSLSSGWYAVAIQIEDFASPSSTVAMSSVPLQFLVEVVQSSQFCSSRPTLVVPPTIPNGQCIWVPYDTTWTTTIVAMSSTRISSIVTASPRGLTKSTLRSIGSQQYSTTVSWAATRAQEKSGPQIFCYYAVNSNGASSDVFCITLLGVNYDPAPQPVPGVVSPSPSSYIPSDQERTEWTIQFDREFKRPTSSVYIRIYEHGITDLEVLSIDASSSNVTHLSDKLTFHTHYNFIEGKSYYVLLDEGVAIGTDFCGSPSPAMTSTTAWTYTAHETRLFQLKMGRIDALEDCVSWSSDRAMKIRSDIHKELLQVILSTFKYKLSESNIQDGVFSCRDSKDQITYRSTIVGTQSYNATTLVECIQDWVSSKPTITVQWYTVDVDHTCPVGISSISDPECGIDPRTRICIARCNPN